MKISIYNFKGISKLEDFELDQITVLSGTNSCGKSSLIQLLLLIKQSLEFGTNDQVLIVNKPYVSLGSYRQIIHNKLESNKFSIKFKFSEKELSAFQSAFRILFMRSTPDYSLRSLEGCELSINFHYSPTLSKIYIDLFNLEYKFKNKCFWFSLQRKRTKYIVKTNSLAFYADEYFEFRRSKNSSSIISDSVEIEKDYHVDFVGLFPSSFIEKSEEIDQPSRLIRQVQTNLNSYFASIQYIGPLREEPKSLYTNEDDTILKIGNKGQYCAHILARNAEKTCDYFKIDKQVITSSTLRSAVKYWLCDVFKMAKDIKIDQKNYNSYYEINIVNENNAHIPITHVGFGISQVLPIIVGGLILAEDGILILEQPEIHLHPKVQSLLFDFLYSLTRSGKTILVETHSDHFITRLRLRIAENISSDLSKITGLYFAVKKTDNIAYEKLDINDLGNLDRWPEDFFDQRDRDLKAIIKAQLIKKQLNR